jgi:predicted ABC-type ATPase
VSFINKAKEKVYDVTLLYLWLPSPASAIRRVAKRVKKGGHNIPDDIITRRYFRGIKNLLKLYIPICENWIIVDNMNTHPEIIANGEKNLVKFVSNNNAWEIIIRQSHEN